MLKTLTGVIHGNTIELDESPGLSDGQRVRIALESATGESNWGEGIKRSAGALAGDAAFEAAMQQIEQERKRATRPPVEL